jgi:hypothetical protein
MVKQAQTFNLRRWSARTRTRVGLPVVIAVLLSVAVVQLWSSNNDAYRTTDAERQGVAYLKPLSTLAAELVKAQSTAVRGEKIDAAALRDAVTAADKADLAHNKTLASSQLWEQAKSSISELISQRPVADGAFTKYGAAMAQLSSLIQKVADTSKLVLDPKTDTYYLMDAAVLRLPNILVYSGRAADLTSLGPKLTNVTQQQRDVRVSVAKHEVSLDSDEISSGLRLAMAATTSSSLGPNITNQLDAFRSAVDAFVPQVNLLDKEDPVDPTTLISNAERLRDSTAKLVTAVLGELDRLLKTRADAQGLRRSQGIAVGVLCLMLSVLLIWMLAQRPEERTATDSAAEEMDLTRSKQQDNRPAGKGRESQQSGGSETMAPPNRGLRGRRRERANDAR